MVHGDEGAFGILGGSMVVRIGYGITGLGGYWLPSIDG
jgi:uncharacterized membrane protein YuzA (DUF378 family)